MKNFQIMKQLTASGKSVFWTLSTSDFQVRLETKKIANQIVVAVNSGSFEFTLVKEGNKYSLYNLGNKLGRVSKTTYNQLINYLNQPSHENSNNNPSTPISSVPLQCDSNSEFSGRSQVQLVRQGDQNSHVDFQSESRSNVRLLPPSVQGSDNFIERLEELNRDITEREKSSDSQVSRSAKVDRRRAVFEVSKLNLASTSRGEGRLHPEAKTADDVIVERTSLKNNLRALADWADALLVSSNRNLSDTEKATKLDDIEFKAQNRVESPLRKMSKAGKRRMKAKFEALFIDSPSNFLPTAL